MAAPTRGRTVFSRPLCSSLLQRPPHPPAERPLENPVRAQLMSRRPEVPASRGNVKHVASSSPVQPKEKSLVHDSVQITRESLKVRVDKHDIPRLPSAQASRFLTRCSHLLCPHIRAANKWKIPTPRESMPIQEARSASVQAFVERNRSNSWFMTCLHEGTPFVNRSVRANQE